MSETICFIIINNDTRIVKSNEVVDSSCIIIVVFVDLCNEVSQVDGSVIILIGACSLNNEEKCENKELKAIFRETEIKRKCKRLKKKEKKKLENNTSNFASSYAKQQMSTRQLTCPSFLKREIYEWQTTFKSC